jgi:hypothetical protein
MDMRGQPHRYFRVDLRHTEGYQFVSQAGEDERGHGAPYLSDEPDPVGAGSAPPTPALLGTAIGHCLSASLLEALRHAHVPVMDFHTEVTTVVTPNAAGLPRIDRVDVVLRPVVREGSPRTGRCEEVFQRHCTVTSSVREGICVDVRVDWQFVPEVTDAEQAQPAAVRPS